MAKDFDRLIKIMRVMPVLFTLTMCSHCGLLLAGHGRVWNEVLLGLLVFVALFAVSHQFGYCTLHKLGLIYGYAVYFCCFFERGVGFGPLRRPLQWIMFIIGLVLTVGFIVKAIQDYKFYLKRLEMLEAFEAGLNSRRCPYCGAQHHCRLEVDDGIVYISTSPDACRDYKDHIDSYLHDNDYKYAHTRLNETRRKIL